MNQYVALFSEPEVKSQTLSIRLSPTQKQAIFGLAKQEGVSVSVLLLKSVGKEFERISDMSDYPLQ